ncbi:AT-rich interactive domain-containing protein 5-like isoform X1 [Chenopodium quinoa]|uniref:AT-rich interactive domain-containing protein 5-like isoform X1 n=1 Tax=Chenopodium quinoa TaxID=63459 RepID=UPI000B78345E|nr:AT-rich interactive domain-containing protein 5-like isoform X1 [Chenopodium quinoa]
MGRSQCEMDVDDGPEEEPELEESDSPDQNQTSPPANGNGNMNGNGNENENGNGNGSVNGTDNSSKRARGGGGGGEEHEAGGASDNKTQNGVGGDPTTPRSSSGRPLIRTFHDASGGRSSNGAKRLKMIEEDEEAGTKEEQAEFIKELEAFYKERYMEFKPHKFYGEPLNCLKLWRAVIQLGGYDRVTTYKLWRQVGESFHPPKTCTTVSWTFRIFYEKALLEYEKHKREIGELEFPDATMPEPSAENEGNAYQASSGRVRRDAAARAMQGWHAQRDIGLGEVGEPIIKDKSINSSQKREKHLKNIGVKQKKPSNPELAENEMPEANKQTVPTVLDVGPPADWVKINVKESKDCYEVYALVPGLLREEVRVQSDPAGRLVITGQPEQLDNPWGITPFRKIVIFPVRIDPLHTSAVVSLHGRLFVRVPFDRSTT